MPRTRAGYDKHLQLKELGAMLVASIGGNDGVPPMCICEDFHGSFLLITLAFLGLLPNNLMYGVPFFGDLEYTQKLPIPLWIYRTPMYQNQPVFNSGCSKHEVKSWVDTGLRMGQRFMTIFAFFVTISAGVPGGIFVWGQIGQPAFPSLPLPGSLWARLPLPSTPPSSFPWTSCRGCGAALPKYNTNGPTEFHNESKTQRKCVDPLAGLLAG